MEWQKQHVLVTGAGGFIGSHLTEALVRAGAQVTAFLHYNSRNDLGMLQYADPAVLAQIRFYFGDIRDFQAVKKGMQETEIVFHLAALIGIPYSYVHPHDVVQTNVTGSLNVFTAAQELGVKQVIHTSTSEVYGTARYAPIDEAHPLQGQSPYSASKIGADMLAESFYRSYQLPVSIVRPFNTYGPRQSTRAVIPTIISQMLTQERVHLGSLHPLRDFNYVADTVSGFMAAACPATVGEVVNVGSGREISIGELVALIRQLVGREVEVEADESRVRPSASEVGRLLANTEKMRRLTQWQPQVSFTEGLQQTIDWIAHHTGLYQATRYTI